MAADTIVAVATAPGAGGVGIVRLSGPRAQSVGRRLVRATEELRPRVLTRAALRGADGVTDDVLVVCMPAPHSYTGEDVIEIHAHGSPPVLHATVRAAVAAGARLARPGEFTQRAFLNGRMDLAQAEAVADLIAARTAAAARCAGRQLGGGLSGEIERLRDGLLQVLAEIEAGLDFSEEELDLPSHADYAARLQQVREQVSALLATAATGRLLHEGATVVIVGPPNAGKSSLFNALLKRERAIVTAEPGTTRDTIEGEIDFDGVPLRLVDTAGIRDSTSEAEALGVDRSRAAAVEADVILWVVDRAAALEATDVCVAPEHYARTILLYNKCDLPQIAARTSLPVAATADISAQTGEGLELLHDALRSVLHVNGVADAESPVIVRARHAEALERTRDSLGAAIGTLDQHLTMDCVALDVRDAMDHLGAIVGARTTEDLLNHIFGQFCIGK